MDIVDEKFLSENFSDTAEFSISPKIFVTVMNILEMDCYKVFRIFIIFLIFLEHSFKIIRRIDNLAEEKG